MKIQGSFDPFRFFSGIKSSRTEGEGGSGKNDYDPNQTRKDRSNDPSKNESNENRKDSQQDSEKLRAAIDDFQKDEANQASGLSAHLEGSALGLKVVVRDINGHSLRQFSGEEFLRLRDSASADSRHRGKILDQKL